jgi:hypothetical protein
MALDTPKPPPRPPAAEVVAPTPARTAAPPGPVVAVGERLEREVAAKGQVQWKRRASRPARQRRERATALRERADARRDEAISRREQALARRDEKRAARGAAGTRGRGNAGKPVKAPGSSRAPRAPAKKLHPVTGKPEVAPGRLRKQQREAEVTPTPTPEPTPRPKQR